MWKGHRKCKACANAYRRHRYATNERERAVRKAWQKAHPEKVKEYQKKVGPMSEASLSRPCKVCGSTEFYVRPDGRHRECNVCRKAKRAERYAADPDAAKRAVKEWQKANPEKVAQFWRRWLEANRDVVRVRNRNRNARKRANGGRLSPDIISSLYSSQRGMCVCCHQPLGDDYHLDHIIPLCQGGTNTDDNVQLLRAQCNREKSRLDPITFMQRRGFLL
ncbi:HNH endonuclease [Massilia litorea]|uniref:HNH endonuclease n=1 Tax=Massilia litorea TaxID=2769491 RepID=A0A7L9U6P2_9BURK|nr:HNH endonuclease [Massilia litorea]QOL49726.1 HNH endonuclease [Massilia litorea]